MLNRICLLKDITIENEFGGTTQPSYLFYMYFHMKVYCYFSVIEPSYNSFFFIDNEGSRDWKF